MAAEQKPQNKIKDEVSQCTTFGSVEKVQALKTCQIM